MIPKQTYYRNIEESFIVPVANYKNNTPRKYLEYETFLEVFMDYINLYSLF